MKIEHLINNTYQVTDESTVWFQGSLADCEALLKRRMEMKLLDEAVKELRSESYSKQFQNQLVEEQLVAILKIVNESPYGWLDIDSNEADEIRNIIKQ